MFSLLFDFNFDRSTVLNYIYLKAPIARALAVQIDCAVANLDTPKVQFTDKARKHRTGYAQTVVESVSPEAKEAAHHEWDRSRSPGLRVARYRIPHGDGEVMLRKAAEHLRKARML